eukprot:jgi/Tetstr1/445063/TSEL_032868.t1
MADLDRKVRPIYDALDARNWKKGLQLAESALSKWKGAPEEAFLVQVLKAVALQRLGRTQEAVQVCDAVRAGKPSDDHLLNTMALVYKPAGEMGKMAEAYEAAAAAAPGDEDLQRQVFGMHIRCGNLVKQQQTAMKLSRSFGGDVYGWWVTITILQQARRAMRADSSAMNPAQLLKLAASMIARQKSKNGQEATSHEQLLVFLDVAHAEGRHAEALEALRGPMGALASIAAERQLLEAHCLERLSAMSEAAAIYKVCWEANPDDLALAKLYMDCSLPATRTSLPGASSRLLVGVRGGVDGELHPAAETEQQGEPGADSAAAVDAVQATVDAVLAAATSGPHLVRGPHLAAVELAARKHRQQLAAGAGDSEASAMAIAEAVVAYFEVAATKMSCAADLRPYTPLLAAQPATAAWACAELTRLAEAAEAGGGGGEAEEALYSLRRRVASYQVQHDLGLLHGAEAAASLMELYAATLPLSADIDERERGPGDDLVALAASALLANGRAGGAAEGVLAALLVACAGARERPFSPGIRIAASTLFGLLGCPQAATKDFTALDVKNIQHSSITGHLLLPHRVVDADAGQLPRLKRLLSHIASVHEDHMREAGDTIMMAYIHESYSKVLEFSAFAERLQRCHSRYQAVAEDAAASLRAAAATRGGTELKVAALEGAAEMARRGLCSGGSSGGGEQEAAPWESMRFNEDLTVRPNWAPPPAGPAVQAVPQWWAQHRSVPVAGYGCCWWSAQQAAESTGKEAAATRAALAKALRVRSSLPHLLSAALSVTSAPQDSGVLGEMLTSALPDLPAGGAAEAVASLLSIVKRGSGAGCGSLAAEAGLCSFLLWAVAEGLGQRLTDDSAERLTAATAAMSAQLHYVSRHARELLEAEGDPGLAGVLAGDAIVLPSVLLREEISWATACLEVWAADLKAARKKKGGKKAAAALPGMDGALAALAGLCEAVTEALSCVAGALQGAQAAAEAADASAIAAALEARHPGLWSWSTKGDGAEVILEVLTEQRRQLAALAGVAADRLARVKAVAALC